MIPRTIVLLAAVSCAGEGESDTSPPIDEPVYDCEPGSRTWPAGSLDDQRTADGFSFNARTPDDYDPTVAYPLLMVYAPAGANAAVTEGFTGLTAPALEAGYIVVYAQHVSPRSAEAVAPLGAMAAEITEKWCVDRDRVYLTGHSDGGSISTIIALFDQAGFAPAAIAPSAAGISAGLLNTLDCPGKQPVMVLHSINDTLFSPSEGFGEDAAAWWAACNACDTGSGPSDIDGCVSYDNCADDAEVLYCEQTGGHGSWPDMNAEMLAFFGGHGG